MIHHSGLFEFPKTSELLVREYYVRQADDLSGSQSYKYKCTYDISENRIVEYVYKINEPDGSKTLSRTLSYQYIDGELN